MGTRGVCVSIWWNVAARSQFEGVWEVVVAVFDAAAAVNNKFKQFSDFFFRM